MHGMSVLLQLKASTHVVLLLLISLHSGVEAWTRVERVSSYYDFSQWKATRFEGQKILEIIQEQRQLEAQSLHSQSCSETLISTDTAKMDTMLLVGLRGGGVAGVVRTLFLTALKNPTLIFREYTFNRSYPKEQKLTYFCSRPWLKLDSILPGCDSLRSADTRIHTLSAGWLCFLSMLPVAENGGSG